MASGFDFQQSNNEPASVPRTPMVSDPASGDISNGANNNTGSNNKSKDPSKKGGSKDDDKNKDKKDKKDKKGDKDKKKSDEKNKPKNQQQNASTESEDENNGDTKSKVSALKKGSGAVKKAVGMIKEIVQMIQMGAKLALILSKVVALIQFIALPLIVAVTLAVAFFTALTNWFTQETAVVASLDEDVCDVYIGRSLIANPYGNLNTEAIFNGGTVDLHDLDKTTEFDQNKTDANIPGHLDGYSGTTINDKSARTAVARRIYSVMLSYGLRPEQIFGMLGNWMVESQLDPTAVETVYIDPFNIGDTKQYFAGMDFQTKFCNIADMEQGGMTAADRIDYFKNASTIGRIGIGLGQWTDIYPDGSNELKAGVWGRNSKLRRYAMLLAKDWRVSDAFTYDGDKTNYAMWYDVDTQLAYALDTSEVGDSGAGFLNKWAAGFPWHRLTSSDGKTRGALKTDGFYDDDCPDATSEHPYNEKYHDHAWRRLGINDNFAQSTGTGDKQVRQTMPWVDDNPLETLSPFPVTADNPSSMEDCLSEPTEGKSNKYNVEPDDNGMDDGYYDYDPDFEKNLETEESNKFRTEASDKALQVLKGLWEDEGEVGKEHKENVYDFEDYCEGFACDECLNCGVDESISIGQQSQHICQLCDGGSHDSHERCYDMDGNGQVDYIERHDWEEVTRTNGDGSTYTEWVRTITVTHEMRGGDSDGTGIGGGGSLRKKSVCGCSEKKFRRCFNKTYRHILGRFVTEQYAEQFALNWEGGATALAQRKANAVTFYEIWWRNTNKSKSQALDPNASQHELTNGGLFKAELGYGAGIRSIINHTQDSETWLALRSKNYTDDADLLNCKHYKTRRNDDIAIAGALIGGAKSYVGSGVGTAVYTSIQDQVLEDNICYKACDHTVATAVRWSGVDDDYPAGPTLNQIQYLVTSPRWVEIDWSGDESELEPGDIFIRKDTMASGAVNEPAGMESNIHHTFMYLGKTFISKYGTDTKWPKSEIENCNVVEGSFGEYGATFHKRNLGEDAKTYHVFRCLYRLGSGRSKYLKAVPESGGGSAVDGTNYGEFVGD